MFNKVRGHFNMKNKKASKKLAKVQAVISSTDSETIRRNLLEAERELIDATDAKVRVDNGEVLCQPSVKHDIKKRVKKAEKECKEWEKKLAEAGLERIDVFSVPSKKEEREALEKAYLERKKQEEESEAPVISINGEVIEEETYTPRRNVVQRSVDGKHNLAEVMKGFSSELKFNHCGIDSDDYKKEIPENQTSMIRVTDGDRDEKIVNAYLEAYIKNNALKAEDFMEPHEGEFFYVLKKYLDAPYGTPDKDMYSLYLTSFGNTLSRQVNLRNDLFKRREFSSERFGAKEIADAYKYAKVIKVAPSLGSKAPITVRERNPLKEAAWLVTHSYLINSLLKQNAMYDLVPKNKKNLIGKWNEYISSMNDLPALVKEFFMLDDDCNCAFVKYVDAINEEEKLEEKAANSIVAEYRNAEDCPPEDDTVPFVESLSTDAAEEIAKASAELDKMMADAIAHDDAKDANVIDTKIVKISDKKEVAVDVNAEQQSTPKSTIPAHPSVGFSRFADNNVSWENSIPKLNKFTNIVTKKGLFVTYEPGTVTPGLIYTNIYDANGNLVRFLLIDPYFIYGDQIRIITVSNDNADIRKEMFIPLSQENVVVKAIEGTLTKEDKKKLNESLPRCMTDFREKYTLIDRVDLRGLKTVNGFPGMPFVEWRKMITNISNILVATNPDKTLRVPKNIRFRLVDVVSPNKFKMICDENSFMCYKSDIYNEKAELEMAHHGFWVDYDPEKYKDKAFETGFSK